MRTHRDATRSFESRREDTMHDRVLLLMHTQTYKARAFLEAAARLDVAVVVATERPQATARLNPGGHLVLDEHRPPLRAVERIVAFGEQHPLSAVIAVDDERAFVAARAARRLGLLHNPVAAVRAARSKYRTRQVLARAGLLTPWFRTCPVDGDPRLLARESPYPCVLKPLSLAASRGVIRADDEDELVAAFKRIRAILRALKAVPGKVQQILVESFIPGMEVAVEGLLSGGRLRILAVFDKPDPLDGPFFEETLYVTPSRHPAAVQDEIRITLTLAVAALGLREGPIHAELRINPQGAWVLEIAPRSIGGLCARSLRFTGGVSLEELILRQALGRSTENLKRERQASGVMMIPIPKPGILKRVGGTDEAAAVAGIDEVRITLAPGQDIAPPPEGNRYLGFLFARAASPQAVEAALRTSHQRLQIDIDPASTASENPVAGKTRPSSLTPILPKPTRRNP